MEEPNGSSSRRRVLAILCGRTSLLVLMTGYACLGALLFKSIEGGEEISTPVLDFQKSREDCLKELWIITGKYTSFTSDLRRKLMITRVDEIPLMWTIF